MVSLFNKRLFFGEDAVFKSIAQEKRATLTSQLGFLCILISLFFTILDIITGYTESFLVYIILALVGFAAILFNRFQQFSIAKTILIVGVNLSIFITYEAESFNTGAYAFYFPIIVGSFAIFGYEKRYYALLLSILSVTLFLIATFIDFSWLPKTNYNEEDIKLYYIVNFIIIVATSILIILFLLRLNQRSEDKLINATEALRENKLRFDLAIKGSSVGIWDWDVVRDRLFLSPQVLDALNYPEEKYQNMKSDKIDKVVHPDDKRKVKLALDRHLKDGTPYYLEGRIRRADGSYMWVLCSGQAEWNKDGNPLRMIGTLVNIDELKDAFKKLKDQNLLLEKTNEELDRFVYSTSHDLKAPLTSIQGLVHLAKLSDDVNEIHDYQTRIEGRVAAMNSFIADIIEYSRNSRLDVVNDEVKLREEVENIIKELKYFERSNQINFIVHIPKSLVLYSDRSRIKIILNNLLSNAVKYHNYEQKSPFVKVDARLDTDTVILEIEDNGVGIGEEYQTNVFNMFFRASEKSEGSGLGLYIAMEMANKISSKLKLRSKEGKGSCFILEIPFEKVIKDSAA